MSILSLHHAQITIPRGAEEAGRRFYCDLLGLPEIPKPAALESQGGFWLQVGDRQVHVGVEDGFERTTTKAHLAYEVSDIAYWRQRMQANGTKIVEAIPLPGLTRFEIRDPFGNRVEFTQRIAEEAI